MRPTWTYPYGSLVCGRFDGRFRQDVFVSLGGERFANALFAAGPDDVSPPQKGGYNPLCSCCWLNFGHTQDYHARQIASIAS